MNRRTAFAALACGTMALAMSPMAFSADFKGYDASTFQKTLAAGSVVVHVHAEWCPVCKKQQPSLQSLSKDKSYAKVQFVTVDFDKDKDFLKANKVANQSVILVFKGGKEVSRLAGVTDADQIRDGVAKAL